MSYADLQGVLTDFRHVVPRVAFWLHAWGGGLHFKETSMATRNPKSSGSSSRSQAAGSGAKSGTQSSEAPSERAKGNSGAKRSSAGGEKKSSGSKSSK
jgi:hypothetical protein